MPMKLTSEQKDALISEMAELVDRSSWFTQLILTGPSGWKQNNEVYKWLQGGAEPGKMNCWEAILVSGVGAGLWDKPYVKAAITKTSGISKLAAYMLRLATPFPKGTYKSEEKGLLVMFGDDGEHFALSGGGGSVLELDKYSKGRHTIQEVSDRSPYRNYPRVYVGAPPNLDEL
jgi:hypothetical protein